MQYLGGSGPKARHRLAGRVGSVSFAFLAVTFLLAGQAVATSPASTGSGPYQWKMHCVTNGFPSETVNWTWLKNGSNLSSGSTKQSCNFGVQSGNGTRPTGANGVRVELTLYIAHATQVKSFSLGGPFNVTVSASYHFSFYKSPVQKGSGSFTMKG